MIACTTLRPRNGFLTNTYASGTPERVATTAVIAASCRLKSIASRMAAFSAAWDRLEGEDVVARRMTGRMMNATSRPPSNHITHWNAPNGHEWRPAGVAATVIRRSYRCQGTVSARRELGRAALLLASAGVTLTNPLARMIASPLGPITNAMNLRASVGFGAFVGMVMA